MELESEIESKGGQGWHGERLRHKLAARGISTTKKGDWRTAKIKALAEEDELDWGRFQEIYGDEAEEKLQQLVNDGSLEFEAYEMEPNQRLWKSQTKVEVDEDGEVKQLVIDRGTPLTLISPSE